MSSISGFEFPPAVLTPVIEAVAHGVPAEEESQMLAAAVAASGGDVAAAGPPGMETLVRQATLRALVGDPELHWVLGALEEWLEGEQHTEAAIPLATSWALPAAGLDLDTAAEEARLYIDAYPFVGRIVGDLDARTARWLARRLALVQAAPGERLPAVRRAIGTLAEAAARTFPHAAASVQAVADELSDERLWYELALRIAQRKLASSA